MNRSKWTVEVICGVPHIDSFPISYTGGWLPMGVIRALTTTGALDEDGWYIIERIQMGQPVSRKRGTMYLTEYVVKRLPTPVRPWRIETQTGACIREGLMLLILLAWGAILYLPKYLHEQAEKALDREEMEL